MHMLEEKPLPPTPGGSLTRQYRQDYQRAYMSQVLARLETAVQQRKVEMHVWLLLNEAVRLHAEGCQEGIEVDESLVTITQRVDAIVRMAAVSML